LDKTDSIYTIEDLVSGKRITTQIHNLHPFIYDPIRIDSLIVTQYNKQDFIDDSSDSWEPYKVLMHVGKFHNYLQANKIKTPIPKELK
jgi:hypothetical protein